MEGLFSHILKGQETSCKTFILNVKASKALTRSSANGRRCQLRVRSQMKLFNPKPANDVLLAKYKNCFKRTKQKKETLSTLLQTKWGVIKTHDATNQKLHSDTLSVLEIEHLKYLDCYMLEIWQKNHPRNSNKRYLCQKRKMGQKHSKSLWNPAGGLVNHWTVAMEPGGRNRKLSLI